MVVETSGRMSVTQGTMGKLGKVIEADKMGVNQYE